MHINKQLYVKQKKVKKPRVYQKAWAFLLLLPLVLFALSGFTFMPNIAQTQSLATRTTLPRTIQMNKMLTFSTTDVSCSDVITLESLDITGIKLYLNDCELQHLSALFTSVGAGAAFIGLICPECAPLAAWIATIMVGATGGIDFLQYASQSCGGAFLDISLSGEIKFEPACDIQS